MSRKYRIRLICMAITGIMIMVSCGGSPPSPEPKIYLPSQFLWQKDSPINQTSFPLTTGNPGHTIQEKKVQHERGFGPFFQAPDLYIAAEANGQQLLNSEIQHMQTLGWQLLFKPTSTGSFPIYGLYVTFHADSYYCFVEYTASRLDEDQGSQTLDVYYN